MLKKLKRIFQRKPIRFDTYMFYPPHFAVIEELARLSGKTVTQVLEESLGAYDTYIENGGVEQGHQRSRVLR